LQPQLRIDKDQSKFSLKVQKVLLDPKRDNLLRSLVQLILLLECSGQVAKRSLLRSSAHRLLQRYGLYHPDGATSLLEEHCRFEATYANDT